MNETIRIGVLGLTHDHVWDNLPALMTSDIGELVAAADPHPPLLDKVRNEYGCRTYESYDELLDRESPDAVYIYTDNAAGAELAVRAIERGLHVLIEKPLATHLAGAETILAALQQSPSPLPPLPEGEGLGVRVRLMVNWPFAWWPQLQHAVTLAQNGELGDVWQVKYRAAHAGPREMGCSSYFCDWLTDPERNGAGALMDYCCYGVILSRVLLGRPSQVTGIAGRLCKRDIAVEDNAVIVTSSATGIGIAEASWTQIGKPTGYVTAIYGTKATLLVEPRQGGRLLMATTDKPEGVEIDVPAPAPHRTNSAAHFLWGVTTGGKFDPLCRADLCRDAQEILEAGLFSSRTGATVPLPLAEE